MRHPTQPPNHSRLLWTVAAVFIAFAALVAIQWDRSEDAQIRWQLATTRSQ